MNVEQEIIKDYPLISVIVPVYKAEKYIHRCVDSILQQTYKNLEIILVDDGSPDLSGEICDEYAKIDSRIKVIHKKNEGVSDARNRGLDIATGEYVVFVDSDDYVSLDLIEVLYSRLDDADYVSCGFSSFDSEERINDVFSPTKELVLTGKDTLYRHYIGENAMININSVYVWGKLYRRELWENLRFPKGLIFEDIYLMPYILLTTKKVKFIPYVGYYYRKNPNSITNNNNVVQRKKAFIDSFTIWDNHEKLYEKHSFNELSVAVKCLKIEKIISHSLDGSIPNGEEKYIRSILKSAIRDVVAQSIPLIQKIKYVIFWLFGKNIYKFLIQNAKYLIVSFLNRN